MITGCSFYAMARLNFVGPPVSGGELCPERRKLLAVSRRLSALNLRTITYPHDPCTLQPPG